MSTLPCARLRTAAFALAAAAALLAAPASAQNLATDEPPRPVRVATPGVDLFGGRNAPPVRFSLGVVAGVGGLFDSNYNRALRPWGYGDGWFAATLSLEAGFHLNRYVMLGARGGFLGGSTGDVSHRGEQNPGLSLWDTGAVLRLSMPVEDRRREHLSVGIQFEGGIAAGTLSLRHEELGSALMPRLGVSALLSFWEDGLGMSLRVSYQHANWPGAGGQGVDLGLDGMFFALSIDGGL